MDGPKFMATLMKSNGLKINKQVNIKGGHEVKKELGWEILGKLKWDTGVDNIKTHCINDKCMECSRNIYIFVCMYY